MARASAVLVLNDCETDPPVALLESSLISARRIAASAAPLLTSNESAGYWKRSGGSMKNALKNN
jgi:hypothetical protein